jgi:hypothetical protein
MGEPLTKTVGASLLAMASGQSLSPAGWLPHVFRGAAVKVVSPAKVKLNEPNEPGTA